MGTSGSFGGSGGKDASNLRDSIADWLDDAPGHADGDQKPATDGDAGQESGAQQPNLDLAPALGILLRPRAGGGGADGPGGGGGGGTPRGGTNGGRSAGGAQRSVGGMSRSASRAGRLAIAYSTGDRQTLARAGLNYDQLVALSDPVEVGYRILQAAFDTQPDSTIEDSEERDIAATVVEWILEEPVTPSPEDVVRKAIETIVVNVVLTEAGDTLRKNGAGQTDRQSLESAIRDAAEVWSQQVTLTSTGASESELADAIEAGIRELGTIFGVKQ